MSGTIEGLAIVNGEIARVPGQAILIDGVDCSPEHVHRLQERNTRLSRLEAAGVNNWEGYEYAFEDDDEDEDIY